MDRAHPLSVRDTAVGEGLSSPLPPHCAPGFHPPGRAVYGRVTGVGLQSETLECALLSHKDKAQLKCLLWIFEHLSISELFTVSWEE